MKNILLVGTGRVGRAIGQALTSSNVRVDNLSSRLTLSEIRESLDGDIESFDLIIWAGRDAGLPTNPDNSSELYYDLLREIEKTSWNGYFVFISSAGEIYGEARNFPAQETDLISPISQYGNLKAKHEILLSELSKKNLFPSLIVRASNIYEVSLEDPGIVGAILRSLLLKENFELQDGNQTRDFIELRELSVAIEKLVSRKAVGIYNVATGHSISINHLVALSELRTSKSISVTRNNKVGGIVDSRVSIVKLESLLHWKPMPIENYLYQIREKYC